MKEYVSAAWKQIMVPIFLITSTDLLLEEVDPMVVLIFQSPKLFHNN